MFKKILTKTFKLVQIGMSEVINDGLDQEFVQYKSKILENMMWPKYCRIIYLELIIIPIYFLNEQLNDKNYNGYPETIGLYCFFISLIIAATFEKVTTNYKLNFDRLLLIKIMILLAELTSGVYTAEMEIRLKSDISRVQSLLQILFFLIIVPNIKVRVFFIIKLLIYRGIRNEITLFHSGVAYHNIFLIILIPKCMDIQFIELIKLMHFCQVSFKSVPSAVCILSQNCEKVLFKNSFMNKMVNSKYRDQTLKFDVSQIPPLQLASTKSNIQPIENDPVLNFISHLYVNFDEAKSYVPSLEFKQYKKAVEDDSQNVEENLVNLLCLIQQIANLDKPNQGQTYKFQCFLQQQEDNIQSIEINESKFKVMIEVRIKTQLQYVDIKDTIMINFLDVSTHLKKVYYKKMNLFKSRVIKSISHELRTRLNVIQGMVQILQTDHELDDKIRKFLKTIFNNCRIQNYIIESIINYNLLMESNISLKKEKFKINDIIQDVISLFSEEAEVKQTNIVFYIDQNDQVQYESDVDKIKSILIHFLSNSIKHTKKGEIMIRVHNDLNSNSLIKQNQSQSCLSHNIYKSSQQGSNLSFQGSTKRAKIFKTHGKYGMSFFNQQSIVAGQCHSSQTTLKIEIKDNGIGIEPEKLMFIQEMLLDDDHGNDAQFSDVASGAMIGLRASNQIARYLNNTPENYRSIRIDSNHLQGTTIILTLKLQADFQQHSLIESEAPLQHIQGFINLSLLSPYTQNQPLPAVTQILQTNNNICNCQKDILIVDDEPYNLIVLESLLSKLNQQLTIKFRQVIKADDGKHAIEIIMKRFDESKIHKCKSIKAIIMDYQMPIINGENAAKQILSICNDHGLPPIPIFGLTGFSGEDDIKSLLSAGMVDVYIKPITMAILEDILSKLQKSEFKSGHLMNSDVSQVFQCIEAEYEDAELLVN